MDDLTALAARVAALEAERGPLLHRVGLLEDRTEIERLQRMYGYYIDNRMWDAMTELFAQDGSIEIGRRGKYIGRERVRALLAEVIGRGRDGMLPGEIINHMQLQGVITVADDRRTARGRWRALIQGNPPPGGDYMMWAEGVYENGYVVEDGRWKIASLWWAPTFYMNVPGYETVTAQSLPPDRLIPPDAPSTPQHERLTRSFLPFHYDHPITGAPVELVVNEGSDDVLGYDLTSENRGA